MPIPKDLDPGAYDLWLTVLDQASGDVGERRDPEEWGLTLDQFER